MNAPSPLTRLTGTPRVAALLIAVYALVIWGWSQGQVHGFLALIALAAIFQTLGAMREVRTYKNWKTNWDAMGQLHPTPPPKKTFWRDQRRQWKWLLNISTVAYFVLLPLSHQQTHQPTPPIQSFLWVVSGLYVAFLVLRAIVRRFKKPRKAKAAPLVPPVEWMLRSASSSPSRMEATQKLPDYCARLLK